MNDLEKIQTERKKILSLIVSNARGILIALILFAVIVIMTTDIRFVTISSLRDLGLEFYLLLFTSYSMYILCADGGTNAGLVSEVYTNVVKRFEELKDKLQHVQYDRLNDFCEWYAEEELKQARMHYLLSASVSYETYIEKYSTLRRKEIKACQDLSSGQKKAIISANRIKRLRITPMMLTTMQGKGAHSRYSLSITPRMIKRLKVTKKIITSLFTTAGLTMIAFQVVKEPSWTIFVEVCIKLVTVAIYGFDGRNMGFDNITIDTVNYTNTQCDMLTRALKFIETT